MLVIMESAQFRVNCYIFLVSLGRRFTALWLFEGCHHSGCYHQIFFYKFRVMLIASGCFQMNIGGFGPVAAGSR